MGYFIILVILAAVAYKFRDQLLVALYNLRLKFKKPKAPPAPPTAPGPTP